MRKGEDENGWGVKRSFDWRTREVKVRRSMLDLASVKAQEKQKKHKKETDSGEHTSSSANPAFAVRRHKNLSAPALPFLRYTVIRPPLAHEDVWIAG